MTQAYEEVMEMKSLEIEEIEQPEVQENEVDELLGDLNPRYFEEAISLSEAQERIYSSDFYFNSQFNIFRTF